MSMPRLFIMLAVGLLVFLALTAQEGCGTAEETPTEPPQPTQVQEEQREEEPEEVGLSAEALAYAAILEEQSRTMGDSLNRAADLFENPLLFDDNWIISVATELAIWRITYDEARALTPPEEFGGVHDKWLQSLSSFDSAATNIANGIDNLDADEIDRGAAKMLEGAALLAEATQELEAILP